MDELRIDLKKIQMEKNDLVDEVVLLQHRLSIQNRKVEECMYELNELRSRQTEDRQNNITDQQEGNEQLKKMEAEREKFAAEKEKMEAEKEKLEADLSDLKNINEEMQHQNETSLEMYIMKIQELEEVTIGDFYCHWFYILE